MLQLLCIDFKLKPQFWKCCWISVKCSFQELHIPFIISVSFWRAFTSSSRSVLHAHSPPSLLTLCMWPTVPVTLIKTTNVPAGPHPVSLTVHCLQLWKLKALFHWMVWSHPQPSTRSLPERPRPLLLTGGRSLSTTTLLQRGKEEDKGNILIYSDSSGIAIVIAISQIAPLSIHLPLM